MSELFATLRLLIMCGFFTLVAFGVMLSLPQSKLRELLLPFIGWAVTALSGAYVLLPFDIVPEALVGPFGLADDLVAVAVGIGSAMTALHAGNARRQLPS